MFSYLLNHQEKRKDGLEKGGLGCTLSVHCSLIERQNGPNVSLALFTSHVTPRPLLPFLFTYFQRDVSRHGVCPVWYPMP